MRRSEADIRDKIHRAASSVRKAKGKSGMGARINWREWERRARRDMHDAHRNPLVLPLVLHTTHRTHARRTGHRNECGESVCRSCHKADGEVRGPPFARVVKTAALR